MPETWAWYTTSLAQALPGSSEAERQAMSLVQGHACILAHSLMRGETMIWPDPRLSPTGRHMLAVQHLIDHPEDIECDL